jgi:hypothetical protein
MIDSLIGISETVPIFDSSVGILSFHEENALFLPINID